VNLKHKEFNKYKEFKYEQAGFQPEGNVGSVVYGRFGDASLSFQIWRRSKDRARIEEALPSIIAADSSRLFTHFYYNF
jgi:hypothetical protein